jgi:CelD/BcsL family acetyltransferase involved in cellulose biosynthesis
MAKLSRKKRYNLRRDQRLILARGPNTVINRFEDLERLFELSIKRFSKRDGSPFQDEARKKTFREIINLACKYEVRMVSIEIENEIVGVDLIAIYKGTHYCLQGAYDLEKYPGLGNYANLLIIEDAINLGAKAVDFLEEADGWKDDWFEPLPCFQFKGLNFNRS